MNDQFKFRIRCTTFSFIITFSNMGEQVIKYECRPMPSAYEQLFVLCGSRLSENIIICISWVLKVWPPLLQIFIYSDIPKFKGENWDKFRVNQTQKMVTAEDVLYWRVCDVFVCVGCFGNAAVVVLSAIVVADQFSTTLYVWVIFISFSLINDTNTSTRLTLQWADVDLSSIQWLSEMHVWDLCVYR